MAAAPALQAAEPAPELVSSAAFPLFGGHGNSGNNTVKRGVSADGRYVLFLSSIPNLVPGQVDHNNADDVFVYDRSTRQVWLASGIDGGLTTGNGRASFPTMSADGQVVAFESAATNLVSGTSDGNGLNDVFVYRRADASLQLASRISGSNTTGNSLSSDAAVSADGSFVAFRSGATNLIASITDVNSTQADLFLFDVAASTLQCISLVEGLSTTGNRGSTDAALSADGRYVAFRSAASDLDAGITQPTLVNAIFVWDRLTGAHTLVSGIDGGTTTGNGSSDAPVISANGRTIAFASTASNLITGGTDANGTNGRDVFVYDRLAATLALASGIDAGNTTGNGRSEEPVLSADGRVVVFSSTSSNLVTGVTDANGTNGRDIFIYTLDADTLGILSATGSSAGNGGSVDPVVSADGNIVAFRSSASNLVAGVTDNNGGIEEIFVFNRSTGERTLATGIDGGTTTSDATQSARISAPVMSDDGNVIAFGTDATNLVSSDPNGENADVFVFTHTPRSMERASAVPVAGVPSATAGGDQPQMSADGRYVAFRSFATNLVPGQADTNGEFDVFLRDRTTGQTWLVSGVDGSATTAAGGAMEFSISADGRYVALASAGTLLSAVPTGEVMSVYVFDRVAGTVRLASGVNGGQVASAAPSTFPVISADGTTVAFASLATDLAPGVDDANGDWDVYVHNHLTGVTRLASGIDGGPVTTFGDSGITSGFTRGALAISANGSVVAYTSHTTDLVTGFQDNNSNGSDVFAWNGATSTIKLVSGVNGTQAGGNSSAWKPLITPSGRHVAFWSQSDGLLTGVSNPFGQLNVYVHDRTASSTWLASGIEGAGAAIGDNLVNEFSMSADGNLVAFESFASNLLGSATLAAQPNIYLYNRNASSLTLVSRGGAPNTGANGESRWPTVSADGSTVVFYSRGLNLVPGLSDTNGDFDLFLFSRATGAVSAGSTVSPTRTGSAGTYGPDEGPTPMTADALVIAFNSSASDLVADDHDVRDDVFVLDRRNPLNLSLSDATISEGGAAISLTATLAKPAASTVTARISFLGSATLNQDFTASNTLYVVVPANATTGTITLTPIDDALSDAAETLIVSLVQISGPAQRGTVTSVQASIADNDQLPVATLSASAPSVSEAGASVQVTVTLDKPAAKSTTIRLNFDGTALRNTDYTASGLLTIPAAANSASVTLTTIEDALTESLEYVRVSYAANNPVTVGTPSTLRVDIVDNDGAVPTLTFSAGASSLSEAGGTALLTATLSAATTAPVTVNIAYEGSASPADFSAPNKIVVPAGSTQASIVVTGIDDALYENETLKPRATSVSNATLSGASQLSIALLDDDPAPSVTLAFDAATMPETGGSLTLTATLDAPAPANSTIAIVYSGSAASGDYTRAASILIPAGSNSGSITLGAVADAIDEPNETIKVAVGASSNAVPGTPAAATATILDDD